MLNTENVKAKDHKPKKDASTWGIVSAVAAIVVAIAAITTMVLAHGEFQANVRSNKEHIIRHEELIQKNQDDIKNICGRLGRIESGIDGIKKNQEQMIGRLDNIIFRGDK